MIKKCKECGKEFKTYNSKRKFCSRKCFYEWLQKVSMNMNYTIVEDTNTKVDENANNT